MLDVFDRGAVLPKPRAGFSDERRERRHTLDPSAHGVVHFGFASERLHQGAGIAGHQAVEIGHGHQLVPASLVQELLQHRR